MCFMFQCPKDAGLPNDVYIYYSLILLAWGISFVLCALTIFIYCVRWEEITDAYVLVDRQRERLTNSNSFSILLGLLL